MVDKKSPKRKGFWARTDQSIDNDRPVNLKITLPSALKPAQPPKGSKWNWAHSFSNVESPVAGEPSQESGIVGRLSGSDVDNDRPVNQKITLPSALKPAKPPRGSKWRNRPDPSTEPPGEE